MNTKEFLLRLKLQKGIGYVKMLQIASQLDTDEVNIENLEQMQLSFDLREKAINAYHNDDYKRTIERINAQCKVVSFFDDEYPEKLRQIYQPPLILFARGDVSLLQQKIITIVGARAATVYSQNVISELTPKLVKENYVIASGLAKGVDRMAHEASLANHGKTIAVVGNGLNHYYPIQNQNLQNEIIKSGLLLSEYLPDTPPRPFRFPERNRILAGLSQSVIITEAREQSGSLITANLALQENRDVYAVPGPITNDLSKGPNKLIEAGAIPIVDFNLRTERFDNSNTGILFSN
ncbi:DNA-processing protein DprA [Lactobacillus sp. LL6]|uniref:DNA-processing protein DprA n=1 Tax=Lactobacillus sp. LL6 TaxID=2596827 RepID=UPI001185C9C0|nr:DNA-processing protein DprA [Lactobacillus sp. LL6]TSO26272.1 DNA-protecting protein DprA [Lactobacillus sp. LL6]